MYWLINFNRVMEKGWEEKKATSRVVAPASIDEGDVDLIFIIKNTEGIK